jgi:MFS family permease
MRAAYGRVFGTPHFKRLLFSAIAGRLPIGIDALALVLLVREELGSYASAGAVAGAFAAGGALGAPIQGRLLDRHGPRLLLGMAIFHAAALVGLVALILLGAPLGVLVLAGVVAGCAIPPISSVMRTLWPEIFRDEPELVRTAFAVDSVAIEMVFVLGPLITAIATIVLSPVAAIAVACVFVVAGTATFITAPPARAWERAERTGDHGRLGALGSKGLRTVLLATLPLGFAFGTIEVAMPGFSEGHGGREWAGVLLAVWSLGSAAGGLIYGARPHARSLAEGYIVFVCLLPLGFAPLLAANSMAAMLPLAVLAGMAIAPAIASANQLVGEVAPPGAVTEAYTWGITALVAGVALGNAGGGALVEAEGWRVSVAAGVAAAVIAAAIAFTRRATLAPSHPGSEVLSGPEPA